MTEEEKHEMENHVRSLQEAYKLLSSEDLKQLEEEQNIDDVNMDKKVILQAVEEHYLQSCSTAWVVELCINIEK